MDAINDYLSLPEKSTSKTCDLHGDYLSNFFNLPNGKAVIETQCPKCVVEEKAKQHRSDQASEMKLKLNSIIRNFAEGDLPPRFKTKDFTGYQPDSDQSKKALATCQKYAENFANRLDSGGGMIFCGLAGTGKTHLASAIINHIARDHYASVFMSAIGATRHVKATYSKDSFKTEAEAIKDFLRPDLLVIDEVGVQFGTDAEKVILFEIINQRYQHVKPTILISNLTMAELSEYIGERVVDRMYEGGGAILSFDWKSYRRLGR